MKPIFIAQLSDEKQKQIKQLLEHLIWHGCGGNDSYIQEYYDKSFQEVVDDSMHMKLVELNYFMVFYAADFCTIHADKEFNIANAEKISHILCDAKANDNVPDFIRLNEPENEDWER